jgi:hypothetical protein
LSPVLLLKTNRALRSLTRRAPSAKASWARKQGDETDSIKEVQMKRFVRFFDILKE